MTNKKIYWRYKHRHDCNVDYIINLFWDLLFAYCQKCSIHPSIIRNKNMFIVIL